MTQDRLFGERNMEEVVRDEKNKTIEAHIRFFDMLYQRRDILWAMITDFELKKSMSKFKHIPSDEPLKPNLPTPKEMANEVFQLIEAAEKVIRSEEKGTVNYDCSTSDLKMAVLELKETLGIKEDDCDDGSCKL